MPGTPVPHRVTAVLDRRVLESDTRDHDVLAVLAPAFDGATCQADTVDPVGQLSTDQD